MENGFDVRPLYLRPALGVYRWAQGAEWEPVAAGSELAEGDLAMLILRTADHLRHVRALHEAFPQAAAAAAEAVERLVREPLVDNY
jgi:superfamily II RNA helicase